MRYFNVPGSKINKSISQEINGFDIAFYTLADDGLRAVRRYIRYLPERLSLIDVGDMNFDRRDGYRLESIKDRHRRVSICTGVDNDAVSAVKECALYEVNQVTFVIALKTFDFDVLLLAVILDNLDEIIICRAAIQFRLSYSEHVKVGSVDD